MKSIFFLMALFFALSCNMLAQKHFTILSATSAGWAGGMPQSGSGVRYMIKLRLNTSARLTFLAIWIGKDDYAIPEVYPMRELKRELRAGDTVIVNYNHLSPRMQVDPAGNVPKATAVKPAPISYKGAALLSYTVKKVLRYRIIPAFAVLPYNNYP